MSDSLFIKAEVFRPFAIQVLERVGLAAPHAADTAEVLTWTSLRGIDTHGVRNLSPYYVDGVVDGIIDPKVEFSIDSETPLAARTNGHAGPGLAAACWSMRLALDKAEKGGMGFVTMRNSNHLGAASYYAHMAAERDMIGLCMTGYFFAQPPATGVLPLGGMDPLLSTNPIAVAVPGAEEPPFVLDMATSASPYNRIELFAELGQPIPLGWGLDENHQPCTDPAAVKYLLPLGGTRELGGHKGFGLAMVVHFLTGALSGAFCANPDPSKVLQNDEAAELEDGAYAQEGVAHFFAALRIDQFGRVEEFKRSVDQTIRLLRSSTPEPGLERVCVAGEIEHERTRERRQTGIPLPPKVAADLRALSTIYEVPLELISRT